MGAIGVKKGVLGMVGKKIGGKVWNENKFVVSLQRKQ